MEERIRYSVELGDFWVEEKINTEQEVEIEYYRGVIAKLFEEVTICHKRQNDNGNSEAGQRIIVWRPNHLGHVMASPATSSNPPMSGRPANGECDRIQSSGGSADSQERHMHHPQRSSRMREAQSRRMHCKKRTSTTSGCSSGRYRGATEALQSYAIGHSETRGGLLWYGVVRGAEQLRGAAVMT